MDDDEIAGVQNAPLFVRIFAPILDVFLAWGLFASLYSVNGWMYNEHFEEVIAPTLDIGIPTIVAYRAGKVLYGFRGAIFASFVSFSLTTTLSIPGVAPAIVYALITVPFMRLIDYLMELVVNNLNVYNTFSFTISFVSKLLFVTFALFASLFAYETGSSAFEWLVTALCDATDVLKDAWNPLAALTLEPAKVLVANNAINERVFLPAGNASETSIYYAMEPNPGPGAGLLFAAFLVGPRTAKTAVPLALLLLFVGGFHEVYFPYFYMAPQLIISLILGSAFGIIVLDASGAGLKSLPRPASISEYVKATEGDDAWGITFSVLVSMLVSFVVSWFVLKGPLKLLKELKSFLKKK
jgi:PTS system mannitol-specific IIC component